MKVYTCDKTKAAYSAGLIVVAANSLEEAANIVSEYNGGEDYMAYDISFIKEMPILSANTEQAQVIQEMSYFE